jgi:hypothetical protein
MSKSKEGVREILAQLCHERAKSILGYKTEDYADKDIDIALSKLRKIVENKKKDLERIVIEHKRQGGSKLDIINALSEPTGYNQALEDLSKELEVT